MKFLTSQLTYFYQNHETRRNFKMLGLFIGLLLAMIVTYSAVFHFLMEREAQQHSWMTGFYWTLTVMTTLGFGDITFTSDLGRAFSILVLISGVMFLLVVLPFAFIQFFLAPWLEAQSRARAPRQLRADTRGHVLITNYDAVTESLITRLKHFNYSYAVLVNDLKKALELHDLGVQVMLGDLDDPETYQRAQVDQAALVVATGTDPVNTSITFTVRELSNTVSIATNAEAEESVDILHLAGSSEVLQLKTMLGSFLARRTIGLTSRVNIVGHFGKLFIAEASATRSPLVGRTIAQSNLRKATGLTVAGVWERGRFELATPDTMINSASVLILAGTEEQLQAYNELFCIYVVNDAPVLILGGGRVGLAVARALEEREIDYRIVEKNPALATTPKHVVGSAADLAALERAGLREAMTTIVTTSDDDTNIYLTVYCRRLSPDMQIISRANFEKNISTIHRAGADFVMSYASMGASVILSILQGEEVLLFAEGLSIFHMPVPHELAGRELKASGLRERSGCSVVAIESGGETHVNPGPETIMHDGDELILIGNPQSHSRLLELHPTATAHKAVRRKF